MFSSKKETMMKMSCKQKNKKKDRRKTTSMKKIRMPSLTIHHLTLLRDKGLIKDLKMCQMWGDRSLLLAAIWESSKIRTTERKRIRRFSISTMRRCLLTAQARWAKTISPMSTSLVDLAAPTSITTMIIFWEKILMRKVSKTILHQTSRMKRAKLTQWSNLLLQSN